MAGWCLGHGPKHSFHDVPLGISCDGICLFDASWASGPRLPWRPGCRLMGRQVIKHLDIAVKFRFEHLAVTLIKQDG